MNNMVAVDKETGLNGESMKTKEQVMRRNSIVITGKSISQDSRGLTY